MICRISGINDITVDLQAKLQAKLINVSQKRYTHVYKISNVFSLLKSIKKFKI